MKQKTKSPSKPAVRQPTPAKRNVSVRPGVRWLAIAVATVGILVAVVEIYLWVHNRPRIPPPTLHIENPDPALATLVESSREEVLRDPRSAEAWGHLGMVFVANEQNAEAMESLQQAELLNPDDGRWPYLRGMMVARYQPVDGLPILQRAVKLLERDVPMAHLRLAAVLMRLGRIDEAEKEDRQMLAAEPADPFAHLALGKVYLIRGLWNEAIKELKAADADPRTHAAAGLMLRFADGRISGASSGGALDVRTANAMCREPNPPDPILHSLGPLHVGLTARLEEVDRLFDEGNTMESLVAVRNVTSDYPKSAEAWRKEYRVLLNAGATVEAEAAIRHAIELDPNASVSYTSLGSALVAQNRLNDAAAAFRHSIQIRSNDATTHERLGHCLHLMGQREEAVQELRNAIAIRPEQTSAELELARVLEELGRPSEAIAALQETLTIDPDNSAAKKELAGLQKSVLKP